MSNLINRYFPVLDYGFVALKNHMGSDSDIEMAARCSYGQGTRAVSDQTNLIRYLMRHQHTSPFEMCEFVFHIGMPIFVARQMVRHRTASLNEYSGRYSVMPLMFYTPKQENLAKQSASNKQGRDVELLCPDEKSYNSYVRGVKYGRAETSDFYEELLKDGCAKELARIDLPLSTYTYWYWKMDLKNLFHFLKLRLDAHAQYEIRVYAEIIAKIVKQLVPTSFYAFLDYSLYARSFSYPERRLLEFIKDANWQVTDEDIKVQGKIWSMSSREIDEFLVAYHSELETQTFDLDLSESKDFSHFENLMKQHQVQNA